ncbi:MAG: polyphosphate polymerase domain-containing protein [Pseudomonadales bacterium]|nr:polyphosphate polymerase domain-containing protein [Pseudomonadales bacterium]
MPASLHSRPRLLRAAASTRSAVSNSVPALQQCLDELPCHSLHEVGALALMNRFDTKYLLPQAQLPELLWQLKQDYSVLCIEGKRLMRYRNVYFDTRDFGLYGLHHNKRKSRFKVRLRTYLDSATSFLEIKSKNNKDMTDKQRQAVETPELESCLTQTLPRNVVPLSADPLSACVDICYERISLQSMKHHERVSIDIGLCARPVGAARSFQLEGMAIVELKQGRLNRESPLYTAMKHLGCRPQSFSKYCMACASLFPETLKTNAFKPVLARLSSHIALFNGAVHA